MIRRDHWPTVLTSDMVTGDKWTFRQSTVDSVVSSDLHLPVLVHYMVLVWWRENSDVFGVIRPLGIFLQYGVQWNTHVDINSTTRYR